MQGTYGEIPLHVQIVFEESANGHKQAKLVRLPERPAGNFTVRSVPLTAYQTDADGTKRTKPILTVWLYWPADNTDTETSRKISSYIPKYIERLIASDDNLRDLINKQLPGTGWHFPEESLWKP
jgi:hypothetical protein